MLCLCVFIEPVCPIGFCTNKLFIHLYQRLRSVWLDPDHCNWQETEICRHRIFHQTTRTTRTVNGALRLPSRYDVLWYIIGGNAHVIWFPLTRDSTTCVQSYVFLYELCPFFLLAFREAAHVEKQITVSHCIFATIRVTDYAVSPIVGTVMTLESSILGCITCIMASLQTVLV